MAKTASAGETKTPLVAGDIIHALNGIPVKDFETLSSLLHGLKSGSYVVLQVERAAGLSYMTLPLD